MPTERPLEKDHPLMKAWDEYTSSEDYTNSFKWAAHAEHRKGSMWGAYMAGWIAATKRAGDLHEQISPANMKFPEHKAALHLVHNEHLNYYQTVQESIDREDHGYQDWVSEEQKQKAVETNDCWYLQWYDLTPVGFYLLAAADLDVLLSVACERQ